MMNNYLKYFFISFILFILLVGGFNYLINPFSLWGNGCLDRLNCKKTEVGKKIYLTKSFQWKKVQPEIVILGNSRPEMGLNPESINFNNKIVYNLAVRGASLQQQALFFKNMLDVYKPKELILGIDFFDFLVKSNDSKIWPRELFKDSYLAKNLLDGNNDRYLINFLKGHIYSLLSLEAIIASFKTIYKQKSSSNYLLGNGFNVADGFISAVEKEGIETLFEHSEAFLSEILDRPNLSLLDVNSNSNRFKSLKYILDLAIENNIKIKLFINPYHIRYLQVVKKKNKYDMFLDWKVMLVNFLSDNNYSPTIKLHDFSGLNQYTTESVPKTKGTYMKWFWESAHYTQNLGEVILHEMYSDSTAFLLTKKNVIEKNSNNNLDED